MIVEATTDTSPRLVKGNEALAWGSLHGGCDCFFGYPITPQNEVPELLAALLPSHGRVFLQAESEVAAINMVYGAAAAGKRAMTSSSSPGISLMMEGLSYCAGAELPCVVINVQRGGPGLGNIAASQADYFQATKGGGHGDYRCLTLAPWSVQEMYEMPGQAFALAEKYRNPAMILADAVLGSMLEPARIPPHAPDVPPPQRPWATTGRHGRGHHNVVNSLYLDPADLEAVNRRIQAKYRVAQREDTRWDTRFIDGPLDQLVVAYGICARIALSAIKRLRSEGHHVGLLRPVTLFPFPSEPIRELAGDVRRILVVELSSGQMVEDVRLAVEGRCPVEFYGRMGGVLPTPAEIADVLAGEKP